jgi:hypothetical protein
MKINLIRIKDHCHRRLNILLKTLNFPEGRVFNYRLINRTCFRVLFPMSIYFFVIFFIDPSIFSLQPHLIFFFLLIVPSRERWIFQSDERKRQQQTDDISKHQFHISSDGAFFLSDKVFFFWWKLVKFFCKATIRSDVLSNTRKHQQSDNDEQKCNFTRK